MASFFFFEREHARDGGGDGGGGGGEKKGENLKQVPCSAWHRAESYNHEIMTWAKIKSSTLKWLSHPGAPNGILLLKPGYKRHYGFRLSFRSPTLVESQLSCQGTCMQLSDDCNHMRLWIGTTQLKYFQIPTHQKLCLIINIYGLSLWGYFLAQQNVTIQWYILI